MTQAPDKDSLITYPCQFPIKVMGLSVDGFLEAMTAIARQFDDTFDSSSIETRPSSGGKYTGLTLTVRVESREQLDNLYRALTGHPMVKVVL
jgi:uncharacterized protein